MTPRPWAPPAAGRALVAGVRRGLQHLLTNLHHHPRLTSDHVLIAADACDEAGRALSVADADDQAIRAEVDAGVDELRTCSAHLRATASRYSDAPLPREAGAGRMPIEDMPIAAIVCLQPATLVHQARAIVWETLGLLEGPLTDCERLTMSWSLRGALLALRIAEDEVEALQRPLAAPDRSSDRPRLFLVKGEESF